MGVLNGPRRKQFDPFLGRTGEVVLNENHEPQTFGVSGFISASVLYTVPANKRARILYLFAEVGEGEPSTQLDVICGGKTMLSVRGDSVEGYDKDQIQFSFEDAPRLESNQTVTFTIDTPPSQCAVTVSIVEEDAGGGYLL